VRWIFFSLILANAAYFGWHMAQQTQAVSVQQETARLNNVSVLASSDTIGLHKPPVDEPVGDGQCVRLGPFKQELHAEQVLTRLAALDIAGEAERQQVELVKDYWVYLPPYPDANQAKIKLAELNQKGIDSYLIASGALKNGLSLGLYSQKANALNRQRAVRLEGYEASIRENKTIDTGYWVILTATGSTYFNEGLMESLLVRYPEISKTAVPCKTVETLG
jgi:hypothetical protein